MLYDLMGNHRGTIISYCPIMGGKAGLSGAVGVLRDVQRYMEKIKKKQRTDILLYIYFHVFDRRYYRRLFLRQATPLPDRLDRAALQVGWSDLGGMVRGSLAGRYPRGLRIIRVGGWKPRLSGGAPRKYPMQLAPY